MTFALSGWMMYAMVAVLGMMALDMLAGLFQALRAGDFSETLITKYLLDLLHYVFPLYLLVHLMVLDPTGWIALTAYYVCAVGVVLKYLNDLRRKF